MLPVVLFLLDSFATTAMFVFWSSIEEKEEPLAYGCISSAITWLVLYL